MISIVIPTLNEESLLPRLLHDLTRQTEKDFEIIIIDGKSEDKTKEVVEEYQKKLPIQFYEVNLRNVSFQRNEGAKYAQGTYIFFLDADSQLPRGYMKHLKKYIEKKSYLMYIPAVMAEKRDSKLNYILGVFNYIAYISQTTPRPLCTGGTMIIEKHFFQSLGGFDESLFIAEDGEILQRAKQRGVSAYFIKSPHIHMSVRRLEYEGYLTILSKYLRNMKNFIRNKNVKEKIYEYEMGGWRYGRVPNTPIERKIKQYIEEFVRHF